MTQQPKPSPSSKREIVLALTKFAERRQAQVNGSTLATFAEDLEHFSLTDIVTGLNAISSRRRAEGETAFPEIQAIVEEAQAASRNRRIAEARKRKMADEAAESRRMVEHPEDFETTDDIKALADKLAAKIGFEQPKEIVIPPPVMLACPQCNFELPVAANMRFWSSEEIFEYAKLKQECERIADKNRVSA